MQSETIGKLAAALAEFQAQVYAVGKDSRGHGYTYASLGKVTSFAYPIMARCGLSVCQMLGEHEGKPALITTLLHTSGEWIKGTYPLEPVGLKVANNAQQYGAAITYARRYALLACLGIASDDDDAACLTQEPTQPEDALKAQARDGYNRLKAVDKDQADRIAKDCAGDYAEMLDRLIIALDQIAGESHNQDMHAGGE